jgi:hypothetical protein
MVSTASRARFHQGKPHRKSVTLLTLELTIESNHVTSYVNRIGGLMEEN